MEHFQRIEQCGNRVVVTSLGVIHDYGPHATSGFNTNDSEGLELFILAEDEYCIRASASMMWAYKVLEFYVFGWVPRVMRCHREGHDLVWEYLNGSLTRMKRIYILPKEKKSCAKRTPVTLF